MIAWDFLDRSFPWTENSPNPWLGPKQIGLKPTSPGMGGMGAEGGGSIYEIENRLEELEQEEAIWMRRAAVDGEAAETAGPPRGRPGQLPDEVKKPRR